MKHEAHDGLLVMIWLASPLTSSAIPPASGVMQGVTEWGLDALKYEAYGLPLGHGLAYVSVMVWPASRSCSPLTSMKPMACLSVMVWLASPLTSSAIPPASGVMQGVTEWGHDALKHEAHDGLSA